ncbi:MAG: helix-turn-helix domain-containing protein [Candidatus Krumholzibacteria bacterium]|nr:helix-turn-helix domain-containing protein [Candidatus Krumholzibacteria bacterium]MDH4335954.1 helix-turn-helix domain-containing protein [Candidatus Krumholzibacteria bacterium]MDH5268470.1 helix-turn-helix domain-containing protein [Candidatus Krumholzibacteria bacterium]
MHAAIEALSDTRREILLRIKRDGGSTIAEIAKQLSISDEGARQHLILLERQGWVSRRAQHSGDGKSGRPASIYEISLRGEEFFPKRYDELCVAVIGAFKALYGRQAVEAAIAHLTESTVNEWEPKLRGKTLEERMETLKGYYLPEDPFISIERNGHLALVERNCPFTNVALQQPQLCSITVNTLTRLLGMRVSRERTFQRGDGCCEFRVHRDDPVDPSAVPFSIEDPRDD